MKLRVEKIKDLSQTYSISELREKYVKQLKGELEILDEHNQKLSQGEKSSAQQWLDENYPKEERSKKRFI